MTPRPRTTKLVKNESERWRAELKWPSRALNGIMPSPKPKPSNDDNETIFQKGKRLFAQVRRRQLVELWRRRQHGRQRQPVLFKRFACSGNALTPNAASSSDGASGGGGGHSAANAKLQGEELRGDIKKRLLGELEIDPMREMQR